MLSSINSLFKICVNGIETIIHIKSNTLSFGSIRRLSIVQRDFWIALFKKREIDV